MSTYQKTNAASRVPGAWDISSGLIVPCKASGK